MQQILYSLISSCSEPFQGGSVKNTKYASFYIRFSGNLKHSWVGSDSKINIQSNVKFRLYTRTVSLPARCHVGAGNPVHVLEGGKEGILRPISYPWDFSDAWTVGSSCLQKDGRSLLMFGVSYRSWRLGPTCHSGHFPLVATFLSSPSSLLWSQVPHGFSEHLHITHRNGWTQLQGIHPHTPPSLFLCQTENRNSKSQR